MIAPADWLTFRKLRQDGTESLGVAESRVGSEAGPRAGSGAHPFYRTLNGLRPLTTETQPVILA